MKPDPQAYWPLVRFLDDDFRGDSAAETIMLNDKEMIALRVMLRTVCHMLNTNDPDLVLSRLLPVLESVRLKIENVLDLEFNEGRYADDVASQP